MIYAILGIDPDAVAALAMNCLAVAGGFMTGFVVGTIAAYLFDRWLTGGKSPAGLHKVVRYIFAVLFAVIVALIVFAGGNGNGNGTGTTSGTGTGTTPISATTSDTRVVTPPKDPPAIEETLRVTVLSGADVKDEKFYQIDKDRTPRTLQEVKEAVTAKRLLDKKKLAIEILLAPRTDRNNAGVRDLEAYAIENGMRVILPSETER
jgi:hypothetical protein